MFFSTLTVLAGLLFWEAEYLRGNTRGAQKEDDQMLARIHLIRT